jgi:hypothetical protein
MDAAEAAFNASDESIKARLEAELKDEHKSRTVA